MMKMPDAVKSYWIQNNGIKLHCVIGGNGPLIILLHGFPECWYSWRHQLPALLPHFKVVAPDLRGYNESDKPSGLHSYSFPILVDDIKELIVNLGEKKATLVGHDWGAGLAWVLAMEAPEMIEQLIIMNGPHPARYLQLLRQKPWLFYKSLYMLFFQIPWLPEQLFHFKNGQFISWLIHKTSVNKNAFTADDFAYFQKAIKKPKTIQSAVAYYRAFFKDIFTLQWHQRDFEAWPKINAPTLLLWGENDVFLHNELTEGLESLFKNTFQIKRIPRCGHWIQQEQSEQVNHYLLEFLGHAG